LIEVLKAEESDPILTPDEEELLDRLGDYAERAARL